tara:strand:- start:39 stop:281 length:243 start_codon:yes stop_codon:yes gene_type:complete
MNNNYQLKIGKFTKKRIAEEKRISEEIIEGVCDIDAPIWQVAKVMAELAMTKLLLDGFTQKDIRVIERSCLDLINKKRLN